MEINLKSKENLKGEVFLVSTVSLSGFSSGGYETMVFLLDSDNQMIDEVYLRRYNSPVKAKEGHKDTLRDISELIDWEYVSELKESEI